jgi:hypothetical protein
LISKKDPEIHHHQDHRFRERNEKDKKFQALLTHIKISYSNSEKERSKLFSQKKIDQQKSSTDSSSSRSQIQRKKQKR